MLQNMQRTVSSCSLAQISSCSISGGHGDGITCGHLWALSSRFPSMFPKFLLFPLFACCIYPSLPPPRIAAVLSTNRSWVRASFLQAPQTARSSWTSKFTPGSPEKVVPVISCSKNGPGLANGGLQFRDNFLAPFSSGTPLPRAQAGVHFLCECAIFHWPDRQTWFVGLQRPPQIPKSHPISNLQCRCNRSSPVRPSTQSTEPSSS